MPISHRRRGQDKTVIVLSCLVLSTSAVSGDVKWTHNKSRLSATENLETEHVQLFAVLSSLAGIFLHPLRGLTPRTFLRTPPPIGLVTHHGGQVLDRCRAEAARIAFKVLDCLRKVLFRPTTLEYGLGQLW